MKISVRKFASILLRSEQNLRCTHKYCDTLREHMVMNVRDHSAWSFGLAREISGPVLVFSVASIVDNAAAASMY